MIKNATNAQTKQCSSDFYGYTFRTLNFRCKVSRVSDDMHDHCWLINYSTEKQRHSKCKQHITTSF